MSLLPFPPGRRPPSWVMKMARSRMKYQRRPVEVKCAKAAPRTLSPLRAPGPRQQRGRSTTRAPPVCKPRLVAPVGEGSTPRVVCCAIAISVYRLGVDPSSSARPSNGRGLGQPQRRLRPGPSLRVTVLRPRPRRAAASARRPWVSCRAASSKVRSRRSRASACRP